MEKPRIPKVKSLPSFKTISYEDDPREAIQDLMKQDKLDMFDGGTGTIDGFLSL